MQDDVTALAASLDAQQAALSRELERLVNLTVRLARDPEPQAWSGLARNAFDHELSLLRRGVGAAVAALEEALVCTVRARESVGVHVD